MYFWSAEILQYGKHGELVAVGDVEALAEKMVAMIAHNKFDSDDLKARASQFLVDRIVMQYLKVLEGENAD